MRQFVIGLLVVAVSAVEAQAQLFGRRVCLPMQCPPPCPPPIYEVVVVPVYTTCLVPADFLWKGDFGEGRVRGTLRTPEGLLVKDWFPCRENALTAFVAGGQRCYKLQVCTSWSIGQYGPEKVRTIMDVIGSGVNAIPAPMEQKIESYAPQFDVPSLAPARKLAPTPLPPAEREIVVPPRSTIPMPELSEPYVPELDVPPAPQTSAKKPMFQGVRPVRPIEPQHDADPGFTEEAPKKTAPPQGKIAKTPSAVN